MAAKRKEELKLTSEQTERLVELYQEEDLWNFYSQNYHNKDVRRKALENMLMILQQEFPGLSGSSK